VSSAFRIVGEADDDLVRQKSKDVWKLKWEKIRCDVVEKNLIVISKEQQSGAMQKRV
jgi:hypothetical protein